jgi:aspartate kinase
MKTVVMKFGGAAVASPEQFGRIASLIVERVREDLNIVVVVSAMGGMTDQLFSVARQVHPQPPKREMDMLVTAGERVSISLLAMALFRCGHEAISFTGSQAGIVTTCNHSEALIVDVRPQRLLTHLASKKIVIVAGFQGVSIEKEITTLGRGGSDTTAVALGVALEAEKVEFYKDVPGICTFDPKHIPKAKVIPRLTYNEALDIVGRGAKVLHARAIRLAEKNQLPLHVCSFMQAGEGTWISEGKPLASQKFFEECHDAENSSYSLQK